MRRSLNVTLDVTEQMVAEREIRRRLLDYCRGIDRCDAELVASTYHPDSTDDHGVFQGSGEGLAHRATAALLDRYEATMHTIGDSIIDFVGDDTAYVETYVFADHRGRDNDGDFLERFGARYIDRFENRDGAWLVADRVVAVEWSDLERLTPVPSQIHYARGLRGERQDLVYRRSPRDTTAPLQRLGESSN